VLKFVILNLGSLLGDRPALHCSAERKVRAA